jgi:gamma-glutamyltranspeptidase / glutathione hydrolase
MRVAVAASSSLAADAGGEIAALGGNAVDVAIAAVLVSANTEPGVCALAGGGYVTVWPPAAAPETLDGQVRMPGAGLAAEQLGHGAVSVELAYGGGVTTLVDAGAVGVPAALAALEAAWRRHGRLPWGTLFRPAVALTREGFPLPAACHHYLRYSGDPVFGRSPEGHAALHDAEGRLRPPGERIKVPGLADSLETIARGGADVFYRGELARAIVGHVRERGGMLTLEDMAACRAEPRQALLIGLAGWQIATNPPPAVGGAVLGAMLLAGRWPPPAPATRAWARELARVQTLALDFRRRRLDRSADLPADAAALIELASAQRSSAPGSAATVHVSATDDDGLACAITLSAGYGSGLVPPGTGLWLNNCLGELELNRRGLVFGPPGTPLPSNMAPTCARRHDDGTVLAIGSPGADRITTAIHQVLLRHLGLRQPLAEAIAAPRLHLEYRESGWQAAAEPGLDTRDVGIPVRRFDEASMFFGGVGATACGRDGALVAAADPRRAGGTWVG